GIPLSYIMIVPLVFILFLLVTGISLCVVTFAIYYHDAIQSISLATMVLFYISPVFYNIDLVPESIRMFYLFNPMALLLNLWHDTLYWGKVPDIKFLLIAFGLSLTFALAGYTVFNRRKREFAEIV
ncbi:ABC transporter permease, partial [Thermodesulfobacteriota bacterium]